VPLESPAGRAFDDAEAAEAAAAAEGRFTKDVLADKLVAGEMTFDEVLAALTEGNVHYRPRLYAPDTTDPDEIEADSYAEPFAALEGRELTTEQVEALYAAENAAAGPDDKAADRAARVEEAFTTGPGDPYDYPYYLDSGARKADPPSAVLRSRGGIVERFQPKSLIWVEVPGDMDKIQGFGPFKGEARPTTYSVALETAISGEGLREIPESEFAELARSSKAEWDDPYYQP
jgi:hypothetical protein